MTPQHLLLASEQSPSALAPTPASGVFVLVAVMIIVPLVSSALLVLGDGPRFDLADKRGHLLGTAASLASFVIGVVLFVTLLGRDAGDRTIEQDLFTWIGVGTFQVDMTFLYDPLSAVFVLLITGVGTLIHVYSIGYMAHDPRRRRFFGFLNLFIAAMLTLVLAGDYLVLFLGWEGVGLASYLLIGFWQHKRSAAVAAKKAFIVNRVGDVGMALAIMLMFAQLGTTSFVGVEEGMGQVSSGVATALGLLLLLGACGKSAQVPLQSWLLDAMEGPTPVSALIHAATMVTAGVYLVVRSNFVYEYTELGRGFVVGVGLVTLIVGAWIGCAKDDIKKALAGSTMSQIGYMMLAAGLGPAGYAYAIFHLVTHGFFKANMFLGAGSVMHGMDDEVDMRRFGALRTAMPVTFATFAMGYLAIIGFPGFAGFWSKDPIIEAAFGENVWVGLGAAAGAGVTAFYMTRLMLMTFFGEKRWKAGAHPHESPAVMTVPLVVLAGLSVVGGVLVLGDWITEWLTPVTGYETHELGVPAWVFSVGITVLVAIGVAVAWVTHGRAEVAATAPERVSPVTRAGRRDLYGDALNEAALMRPGQQLVSGLSLFDRVGVDGAVGAVTRGIAAVSGGLRRAQTGFVRSYSLTIFGGALVVLVAALAVNLA